MKTLKLSYYTIPIKLSKEDKLILVHGYTGAIDVVSSELYAAISTSKGNIEIVSDGLKEKLKCKDYDVKSRFLYAIKNNKPFPFRISSRAIIKGGVIFPIK